ncbi:hypothetical protein SEMRO_802_G204690.1 [Seminavis robusta]|uniref:Uncharacterized protein n=1 Tax=Seminavis robusta TaxID=568900 RepID=A0A9N8E8K6_9STRA|nr:hypothetical protein SEMRO_802_G204690.1 [Seminavis robusta]|eukprot:Sro802_g204690.1 n/a (210) ;mRNA; r:32078-32707
MKYLDQALNGLGRHSEADQIAANLRRYWKANVRSDWIAKGRPTQGSVHSRLILNHHNDYHVLAKQCYEPEPQKDGVSNAHFKVLAFPKDEILLPHRLFKLEETAGMFVLNEHVNEEGSVTSPEMVVRSYEETMPDIRVVAGHVVEFLGGEEERSNGLLHKAIQSVASRHLPVTYTKLDTTDNKDASVPVCDLDVAESTVSSSTSFHDIV